MTFVEKYSLSDYIKSDDYRKCIVLKDKGEQRKYIGNNTTQQRIVVYRVDDGIITGKESSKCDFAFWTGKNNVYLVELKGGDYSKALQQVYHSIENLIVSAKLEVNSVHARIVLSTGRSVRAHVANTSEVKLNKLLKRYNGTLSVKSAQMEEGII